MGTRTHALRSKVLYFTYLSTLTLPVVPLIRAYSDVILCHRAVVTLYYFFQLLQAPCSQSLPPCIRFPLDLQQRYPLTLVAMRSPLILSLLSLLLLTTTAAETVLGVYIFSRHGDRTPKSTPPTVLTPLGYSEIFSSGTYYRNRYISSSASSPIAGISPDLVDLAQISASAPLDNVLMASAQGFLQGLYPPVGATLGAESLRDNRSVEAPLDGYQLIPVQTVTAGTGSEDSAWLQGAGNCANATTSSNSYFLSVEYRNLLSSTADFYKSLDGVVNATLGAEKLNYKNAYTGE